eukprot:TRINITY_DN3900_c0_g2_i1.p1 TRINITY_DN3900_c0_g2~~TRINITY_DN3900_c0_g2_i1.p1  ORF type:complete len:264 (+),score=55.88 TRINITY_DN3900_c0_g2_i1:349-1140(+)
MFAAREGHVPTLGSLIAAGANLDAVGRWSAATGLMLAARQGCTGTVQTLIDAGASMNMQDELGMTALMLGSDGGHQEVVQLLVAGKADPEIKEKYEGKTALMHAAVRGHTETIEGLLAAGAKLESTDEYHGLTALGWASEIDFTTPEVVRVLLAAKADVNAQDRNGWTPLMRAARRGACDVMEVLLGAGASVDARDTLDGRTALMLATIMNQEKAVGILIQAGAEVDAQTTQEYFQPYTALSRADKQGLTSIAQRLRDAGATR